MSSQNTDRYHGNIEHKISFCDFVYRISCRILELSVIIAFCLLSQSAFLTRSVQAETPFLTIAFHPEQLPSPGTVWILVSGEIDRPVPEDKQPGLEDDQSGRNTGQNKKNDTGSPASPEKSFSIITGDFVEQINSQQVHLLDLTTKQRRIIPRSSVLGILFFPPVHQEAASRRCRQFLQNESEQDIIYLVNGDEIQGTFLELRRRYVFIRLKNRIISIPVRRIQGILFQRNDASPVPTDIG